MKKSWLVVLVLALFPLLIGAHLAFAMEGSRHAWSASPTALDRLKLSEDMQVEPAARIAQPFDVAQMTPEEKRKARRERFRERLQQMTPEQREALLQDVTDWKEAFTGLGSEEQEALTQAFERSVEKLRGLSPEQRQQLQSSVEQLASTLRDVRQSLTSEEEARLQQAIQNMKQTYADLTVVQKTQFLHRIAGGVDIMRNLTPEQKDKIESVLKGLGKAPE
jgi:hypothetical protein